MRKSGRIVKDLPRGEDQDEVRSKQQNKQNRADDKDRAGAFGRVLPSAVVILRPVSPVVGIHATDDSAMLVRRLSSGPGAGTSQTLAIVLDEVSLDPHGRPRLVRQPVRRVEVGIALADGPNWTTARCSRRRRKDQACTGVRTSVRTSREEKAHLQAGPFPPAPISRYSAAAGDWARRRLRPVRRQPPRNARRSAVVSSRVRWARAAPTTVFSSPHGAQG